MYISTKALYISNVCILINSGLKFHESIFVRLKSNKKRNINIISLKKKLHYKYYLIIITEIYNLLFYFLK